MQRNYSKDVFKSESIVSIPFEREGVCKVVKLLLSTYGTRLLCFNSLRAGRCMQRDPILHPVGTGVPPPKTLRELRGAFFLSKFASKTL